MHRRNRTNSVLVSIAGATPQVAGRRELSDGDWWRDAVVYQIYVRSFADGNGDGVGDLPGVISRLEYLRSLDIDAIWLTPFYPSPLVDGGYDVADYRNVEPRFGTLEDFDTLVAEPSTRSPDHRGHRCQPHLGPAPLV